jgi:hypothetical protein
VEDIERATEILTSIIEYDVPVYMEPYKKYQFSALLNIYSMFVTSGITGVPDRGMLDKALDYLYKANEIETRIYENEPHCP